MTDAVARLNAALEGRYAIEQEAKEQEPNPIGGKHVQTVHPR